MSIKSKVFAGAAALSVIAGLGAVGASSAHASTPSCGPTCVTPSNGGSVLDVYKREATVGNKIIMWGQTNYDPATDFSVDYTARVWQDHLIGLASKVLTGENAWRHEFELQYTPNGVPTHLCVGVANKSGYGAVTLRPCGVTDKTLWVAVKLHNGQKGTVLINGAGSNFSNPYVLTNRNGAVYSSGLGVYSDGTVQDNQIWTGAFGVAS
jgi:hypothetical protein